MERAAYNASMDAADTQARYMRTLMGKWPTSLLMPSTPKRSHICVHDRQRPSTFSEHDMALVPRHAYKPVVIYLGEVRNSDGFWAAEFEGTRYPVMFWPAPMEPPPWYGDYANE